MEIISRQKKDVKSDVDLRIPVDEKSLPAPIDGDCFGQSWDMTSKECRYCHDNEFCGLVTSFKIRKTSVKVRDEEGGFFDEEDFDAIQKTAILELMSADTMTVADLVKLVALQSRSKDDEAVKICVKSLIIDNGYITRNGVILKRTA